MAHLLYVDLSAKAEQWTNASAVAAANGHTYTILVGSRAKQRARQMIRERHGARMEQYRLLAILVYLVIKPDLPNLNYVVIDKDYAGEYAESQIKYFLLQLITIDKPDATAGMIHFQSVKGKTADKLAKQVFDGYVRPNRNVSTEELGELIFRK